jgi:hypothetical protein
VSHAWSSQPHTPGRHRTHRTRTSRPQRTRRPHTRALPPPARSCPHFAPGGLTGPRTRPAPGSTAPTPRRQPWRAWPPGAARATRPRAARRAAASWRARRRRCSPAARDTHSDARDSGVMMHGSTAAAGTTAARQGCAEAGRVHPGLGRPPALPHRFAGVAPRLPPLLLAPARRAQSLGRLQRARAQRRLPLLRGKGAAGEGGRGGWVAVVGGGGWVVRSRGAQGPRGSAAGAPPKTAPGRPPLVSHPSRDIPSHRITRHPSRDIPSHHTSPIT